MSTYEETAKAAAQQGSAQATKLQAAREATYATLTPEELTEATEQRSAASEWSPLRKLTVEDIAVANRDRREREADTSPRLSFAEMLRAAEK